jgi:hypothetical protein
VLHGPIPARRPTLEWAGEKVRVQEGLFYEFRPVSVFDFWFSPDSPDTQRGAGVFIRQRWTRPRLLAAAKMKSYISQEIYKLLKEDLEKPDFQFHWLSQSNPDQENYDPRRDWISGVGTVDALLHYGLFSGRELSQYGAKNLDSGQFYDATITVINGRVVQVFTAPNPTVAVRPVHTASFYKTKDRIPGAGIAQRLRDVERCYLANLGYLMRNAANSAEPYSEADYRRLNKFLTDEDLLNLVPGTMYLVDNDGLPNPSPAMRFYSAPSNLGAYQSLLEHFTELAHLATNIPAALHGTAVGTGANRTFRGAAMLQGNAIKAIQSAVGNIDQGVFGPCGELLFNYNMLYEDDEDIKGDCRIMAQGVQGILARELDRNNAMELLQLVGAAGAQLGEAAPRIFMWALKQVFTTMQVPEDLLAGLTGMPVGAPAGTEPMGGPQAPGQMAPAVAPGVPNGNPGEVM